MRNRHLIAATAVYIIVLAAFWIIAEHSSLPARLGHMPSTFTAFGLALAPYWYFGFGLAQLLQRVLTTRVIRLLTPGLLSVPYLVYSIPSNEFRWTFFLVFLFVPMGISALLELGPRKSA